MYSDSYLKFGFVESPVCDQQPLCLLCFKIFSNVAMKPSRMENHLKKFILNLKINHRIFSLKNIFDNRNTIMATFAEKWVRIENGLIALYQILLQKRAKHVTQPKRYLCHQLRILFKCISYRFIWIAENGSFERYNCKPSHWRNGIGCRAFSCKHSSNTKIFRCVTTRPRTNYHTDYI